MSDSAVQSVAREAEEAALAVLTDWHAAHEDPPKTLYHYTSATALVSIPHPSRGLDD